MKKKTVTTAGFLTVTAVAIIWELVASFDGNESTSPWTDLIVEHVPAEVTIAAVGALALWLPIHFGIRYWRKAHGKPIEGDDIP